MGLICLCSGYMHLYIHKKKWKKRKIGSCVYVHSILPHWHVYWYPRVTLSSMFVGKGSYMSFPRHSLLCIHFVICFLEWDEWSSPMGSSSLSLPSLHSLLMWLHFMFDLIDHHSPSYVHCFVIILVIAFDSSSSFHPFILFLQWPIPSLILSLHHSYASHYQFDFRYCLIIIIIFTLGTLKSIAHEIFYICCILYMRDWVLILGIWA